MAVQLMDYCLALRNSDLPGPQRAIAFWIATRCSGDWHVTLDAVAKDSGFSRPTVVRALRELEASGWLVRKADKKKGNRYELFIPQSEKVQSEPTETVRRFTENLQKVQSDPTVGSERSYRKVQRDPTYTRTEQEQIKTNCIPTTAAPARKGPELIYDKFSMDDARIWSRKLLTIGQAKAMAVRHFRGPSGVNLEAFATALYCDKTIFNAYLPWLKVLRIRGEI